VFGKDMAHNQASLYNQIKLCYGWIFTSQAIDYYSWWEGKRGKENSLVLLLKRVVCGRFFP
jgi:hypothetical protein